MSGNFSELTNEVRDAVKRQLVANGLSPNFIDEKAVKLVAAHFDQDGVMPSADEANLLYWAFENAIQDERITVNEKNLAG